MLTKTLQIATIARHHCTNIQPKRTESAETLTLVALLASFWYKPMLVVRRVHHMTVLCLAIS